MPTSLRHHAKLPYYHDDGSVTFHPAMLARVDNAEGIMVTLHRTYVTTDGRKADVPSPKKLMPPALHGASAGGAIRLYPARETLAISEGIETALAVRRRTGFAVWAAVSATGMTQICLPAIARTILIGADHDTPGIEAAHALAHRLLHDGRQVTIYLPRTPQTDWCDAVRHGGSLEAHGILIPPRPPTTAAKQPKRRALLPTRIPTRIWGRLS